MQFTSSAETLLQIERVAEVLRELPIRAVASYTDLAAAAGCDLNAKAWVLVKARKQVEEETGLRFDTVYMVGVKKIDGATVPAIGARVRRTIARKAQLAGKRLTALKYNDIDPATQARIDNERAVLGVIEGTARISPTKIAGATKNGPILTADLLDMIASTKKPASPFHTPAPRDAPHHRATPRDATQRNLKEGNAS